MAIGGSAQFQAGLSFGQNFNRSAVARQSARVAAAEAVQNEGLGVALAGLAAFVKARKEAAAYMALAQHLKDILAEVAPNHPMASAEACNSFFKKEFEAQ